MLRDRNISMKSNDGLLYADANGKRKGISSQIDDKEKRTETELKT